MASRKNEPPVVIRHFRLDGTEFTKLPLDDAAIEVLGRAYDYAGEVIARRKQKQMEAAAK